MRVLEWDDQGEVKGGISQSLFEIATSVKEHDVEMHREGTEYPDNG